MALHAWRSMNASHRKPTHVEPSTAHKHWSATLLKKLPQL
jgi:hypothetical protein